MRATLLCVLLLALLAVAASQPVAPIIKRTNNLADNITSCPKGQGLATNARPYKCSPCKAGFYKGDETLTGCIACPINAWSPQGSEACYVCPGGTSTEGVEASAACTECAFGSVINYSWTGANPTLRCLACGVGEYQPLAGQQACLKCPASMGTNGATGSGECYAGNSGGNTVDVVPSALPGGGAGTAKSLLQILSKRSTKPSGNKHVRPSEAAPHKPQIIKRASYKGKTPRPATPKTGRASLDVTARNNALKAKASKRK